MAQISVPRSCYKYYRAGSMDEFVAEGLASEQHAYLLDLFADEFSKATNLKFVGWAFAKNAYMQVLGEHGCAVVAIVQDDTRKFLLDVLSDEVTEVTREQLDSYFN